MNADTENLKLLASCLLLTGLVIGFCAAIVNAIAHKRRLARRTRAGSQAAFSLIELLLVVAIILVIAAIAIPSLLSSQQRARAASAVGSLKAIGTAETAYMTAYNSYSLNLAALGNTDDPACFVSATSTCQIDRYLSNGQKASYIFTYSQLASGQDYQILADPVSTGEHFLMQSDGVIRFDSVPCTTASPVLQ